MYQHHKFLIIKKFKKYNYNFDAKIVSKANKKIILTYLCFKT